MQHFWGQPIRDVNHQMEIQRTVIPGEVTVNTSTHASYLRYFHLMVIDGVCSSTWKDKTITICVLPIDIRYHPSLKGAKELVLEYK